MNKFTFPAAHVLATNEGITLDLSDNSTVSPPYAYTHWLPPGLSGAYGALWKNGFLVCGGFLDANRIQAIKDCWHADMVGTNANPYPKFTAAPGESRFHCCGWKNVDHRGKWGWRW